MIACFLDLVDDRLRRTPPTQDVVSVVCFLFYVNRRALWKFFPQKEEMPINQDFSASSCRKKILAFPHGFGILKSA